MSGLSIVFLAVAAGYAVALLYLYVGFRKACKRSRIESRRGEDEISEPRAALTISVIVPARNESAHIVACLQSIFENDYNHFDVVVVDDDSDDQTAQLVESYSIRQGLTDRLKLIRLKYPAPLGMTPHKKRAISAGIEGSRGSIIVTTDADSEVPRQWLRTLIREFSDGIDLVSGPVAYIPGTSVLSDIVELEMLGLVAAGGGAMTNGHPNMCNGANLAYRRQAFVRVGGFKSIDHVASGDDVLLMLKLSAEDPACLRFCADPNALVVTQPAAGWSAFVSQRRRWASKGLKHRNFAVTALALLVYGYHAAILLMVVAAFFRPTLWLVVVAAVVLKVFSEGLLLRAACRHFGRPHLMKCFLPAQFLHIPYVTVIGFLGVFGHTVHWKGRAAT